jgi:hypothetical protein
MMTYMVTSFKKMTKYVKQIKKQRYRSGNHEREGGRDWKPVVK